MNPMMGFVPCSADTEKPVGEKLPMTISKGTVNGANRKESFKVCDSLNCLLCNIYISSSYPKDCGSKKSVFSQYVEVQGAQ